MRLRKYGHSCLLLEERGESLLFDPGMVEFLDPHATPDSFASISTIVITHWHPDHADPDLICQIVDRSGAKVLANADGVKALREKGVTAEVPKDGAISSGAFTLRVIKAPHAPLLGAEPPENTAYLVNDRLLNPGDSFDSRMADLKDVPLLALPITAPWLTELEAAKFAERVAPRRVVPVHDGYVQQFFRTRRYQTFKQYFEKRKIGFEVVNGPDAAVEL
jgi:L-ascorbate metabolism protein UlaG (beta-lactamase superfamily)